LKKRKLGNTGIGVCPLVIGGHGILGGQAGHPEQSIEQAASTLKMLEDAGMTHFDYTYAEERRTFRDVIRAGGLEGKLRPIIWYMDQHHEGREENSTQDVVDNVRYHLDELGCDRAGAVIKWDNRWPKDWPAYTLDAMDQLKNKGLTEAVGLGVLAGSRANEEYLWDTWEHWDFIAPYWNYALRRGQMLVEFARERGMGVYSVGAFLRGAVFNWPGVRPATFVRPWLKWILREPSVFGFALSLQNEAEARQALDAIDDRPMSKEDVQTLYDLNIPIQPVDYRQLGEGESAAVPLEIVDTETLARLAKGTNMLSGSLFRWQDNK
jgi:hypothetical protein